MNLEFLRQIVEIDSRTTQVDGVNQVQKVLAETMSNLGFSVSFFRDNQDKTGELLWAQRKGKSSKAITLVCHADTVIAPDTNFNFKINFKESRIYGPGIGDNKGGMALALGVLTDFLSEVRSHEYTLNFISSPSEETGSIGFHDLFKKIGLESKMVLGFEPALTNGDIIVERSGNRWYLVNLIGKSGHAGRWNEVSINAAHKACEIVYHLSKLSDYQLKRRVNIASMKGGSEKYNVVCGQVELKIDTRFKDNSSLDLIHNTLLDYLNQSEIPSDIEIVDDCPPMESNPDSIAFANNLVDKIANFEGSSVVAGFSGGAADINYFQRPSLISIDGLGPIAGGMHTNHEYIEMESFYTRKKIITDFLIELENNTKEFEHGNYFKE